MNEKRVRSRGGASIMSPLRRVVLIAILFVLIAFLFLSFKVLKQKKNENILKTIEIENLNQEIEKEDKKTDELSKAKGKDTTDEDYEELARKELGLIKKDEIVIKPR